MPELNDPPLHEISSYSWRIIYHLREDNVFIVTRERGAVRSVRAAHCRGHLTSTVTRIQG